MTNVANYLFIVTRSDHPSLYLSKADDYLQAELIARKYHRMHDSFVDIWKLEVAEKQTDVGMPAVLLQREGRVSPDQTVHHYINLASAEADKLPKRQALEALQSGIELFTKEIKRLEEIQKEATCQEVSTNVINKTENSSTHPPPLPSSK